MDSQKLNVPIALTSSSHATDHAEQAQDLRRAWLGSSLASSELVLAANLNLLLLPLAAHYKVFAFECAGLHAYTRILDAGMHLVILWALCIGFLYRLFSLARCICSS
jgi:hypothetical protein